MRSYSLSLCLLVLPLAIKGQTSAYQTADGNSSIFLANAKANLIFNISDTKFDLGYLHEGAGKSMLYGIEATGKPSSDFGSLFQKGKLPSSLGGSGAIGYHHPFSKSLGDQTPTTKLRDDWILFQFTYTRSSFDIAESSSTEPQKRTFDGYRALVAYDGLVNAPAASVLFGVAAGAQRQNNLEQLTPATISTPLASSISGIPAFSVTKDSTSGYFGTYKQFLAAPVYTDLVLIPKSLPWLDFDLFTRSDAAHVNRYIEGGIGIFLAKTDNPTQVLGGFSVGWKNGTPTIAFVAGWSF